MAHPVTQQDTQPPAETLASKYENMDVHERATAMADDCVGDPWELLGYFREKLRQSERDAEQARDAATRAVQRVAALTRRAGGDAIPAGVSAVMGRILGHYGEAPDTLARIKGIVAQYREAPFRSADWLAGEIMRILDSEPANDITPKPPAGGDEWSMVNRLRDQEADSVEILCDNPDGDPNNAIVCCGFWTGFVERRFSGDTIADALRSAVEAKDQADRDGHPDVLPAGGDAVMTAALNQNDAMRQELAHVGNLVSDLARALKVDQANDDGTWPDLAGRIQRLIAATPNPPAGGDTGSASGTFACPICGEDTPHHHTPPVVDAYQTKGSRK